MADRYENIRKALEMGPAGYINHHGGPNGGDEVSEWKDKRAGKYTSLYPFDPDTIRALLAERDAQPMPAAIKATIKEALIFLHDAGEDQGACDNALNWLSQHAAPVAAQKEDDARDAERYRWLREQTPCTIRLDGNLRALGLPDGVAPAYLQADTADALDTQIDAAIAAANGGPHG